MDCDCNHCRPWAPGEIREMKGKAMQHYLEDVQGLPRGAADERAVADLARVGGHPLLKFYKAAR